MQLIALGSAEVIATSMCEPRNLETFDKSCSREEDENRDLPSEDETGVLFYVNKDGFPIKKKTWERMWRHVEKIHPKGPQIVQKIRDSQNLDKVSYVTAPVFTPFMSVEEKLGLIQSYLQQLQYNHTGTQFFEIKKWRPLSGLMDTAREMIKESLPIKCLEAVILGLYLTCGMSELQRFTVSFKTQFNGRYYRHVVLGVHHNGKFGMLGLSRREDLMFKPLKFKSLWDLLDDFTVSYNNYHHSVKKIKLSLPVVHDIHSCERIQWKYLTLSPLKTCELDMKKLLDRFTREIKVAFHPYHIGSPRKPDNPSSLSNQDKPSKPVAQLSPRKDGTKHGSPVKNECHVRV